jgi:hypothetical protein
MQVDDRYHAECKLVQLWEELALLDGSFGDDCKGGALDSNGAETIDRGGAPFAREGEAGVGADAGSSRGASRPGSAYSAHHWWTSMIRLALSISADVTGCSRLCGDLLVGLAARRDTAADPDFTVEAEAADREGGCSGPRCGKLPKMGTTEADGKTAVVPRCEFFALQQELECAVQDLRVARCKAEELETEVLRYAEEERRLSLQAMEREEELERAVGERARLAEAHADLSSRLARARGRIRELEDVNGSLVRALPRGVGMLAE